MTSEEIPGDAVNWVFPDLSLRGAGQGGDLTQFTMEGELQTFVREVLQNSNDAGLTNTDEPTEVTFRIQEHSGDELERFKQALRWDEWRKQVDAAAENNQIAKRIQAFADRVEGKDGSEEGLRTMVVEDRHTQGLTGDGRDRPGEGNSNFSALVRDSLESNKQNETAGGKFGLGKAVLRIFSGTSTVLFNSVLSEPDPRPDSPRLIGRTRLPQHFRGDTRHNGQGYFGDTTVGEDEFEPPESLWGDTAEELAEWLSIDREDTDTPGTSVMIVGFRDPLRDEQWETDALVQEIHNQAIKWFWPAMWRGDLQVRVEGPSETLQCEITDIPEIQPFIDALEYDPVGGDMEDVGDVAHKKIDLDVPNRVSPEAITTTDDGQVSLQVRLSDESDSSELNTVAFVRGSGMVVRYWDRSKLVHGRRNFHGIALGGLARTWVGPETEVTQADKDVESFLKDAEPPEHDDWKQTSATRDDYEKGTAASIKRFKDEIGKTIGSLVAPNFERGTMGPQRLANRFPLSNQGRREQSNGEQKIGGETSLSYSAPDNCWTFEADVEAEPGYEISSIRISLRRMAEEGQINDYVPISNLTEGPNPDWTNDRDDGGDIYIIQLREPVKTVSFTGESDTDTDRTKVRLNLEATVQATIDDETQ